MNLTIQSFACAQVCAALCPRGWLGTSPRSIRWYLGSSSRIPRVPHPRGLDLPYLRSLTSALQIGAGAEEQRAVVSFHQGFGHVLKAILDVRLSPRASSAEFEFIGIRK